MHLDPSYHPAAFLLAPQSFLQQIFEADAACPSPSPLVADGGKCSGTGTRMLLVCPPIEVTPLELGVGWVERSIKIGPYTSLPLNKSLLDSEKERGRCLISISCYGQVTQFRSCWLIENNTTVQPFTQVISFLRKCRYRSEPQKRSC